MTIRDGQIGGTHYKTLAVQPWDAIDSWLPREQRIGYYRGNAIKYLSRAGTKGSFLEDIQKAAHYLTKLVEVVKEQPPEHCSHVVKDGDFCDDCRKAYAAARKEAGYDD